MVIGATKQAGGRKESSQEVGIEWLEKTPRIRLQRPEESGKASHANILLSSYYMPDNVLGTGIITVNKSGKVFILLE